jgi:hypothetical protein
VWGKITYREACCTEQSDEGGIQINVRSAAEEGLYFDWTWITKFVTAFLQSVVSAVVHVHVGLCFIRDVIYVSRHSKFFFTAPVKRAWSFETILVFLLLVLGPSLLDCFLLLRSMIYLKHTETAKIVKVFFTNTLNLLERFVYWRAIRVSVITNRYLFRREVVKRAKIINP